VSDPVLFWTAAAAIGQIVGALFTAAAVAVSLWVVLTERREKLQFAAGRRVIIGALPQTLDVVAFELVNLGLSSVHVTTLGWRTGWLSRGPDWMRYRHAVQLFGSGLGSEPPCDLAPGRRMSSAFPLSSATEERPATDDIFAPRKVPLLGWCRPPVYATVYTARGTHIAIRVETPLRDALTQERLSRVTGAVAERA
jgi:hypothetical protein